MKYCFQTPLVHHRLHIGDPGPVMLKDEVRLAIHSAKNSRFRSNVHKTPETANSLLFHTWDTLYFTQLYL